MTRAPHLSSRLQGFGTTVFAEMSALAVATGSVNLGQGFPDYPGPGGYWSASVPIAARATSSTSGGPG